MPAAGRGPWSRAIGFTFLAAPFFALLSVPLYARAEPRIAGLPFFYGYQLLWVLLTPALMFFANRLLRRPAEVSGEGTQEGTG